MCENCVSRIFSQGESACPECGTLLRRINFISQTFEDISIERECRIRKMLNKAFNKSEDDFSDSDKYDDYLEMYEDKVQELMNFKNDMLISKEIDLYKKVAFIHKNEIIAKRKKTSDSMEIASDKPTATKEKFDPLKDVEKPTIVLRKTFELPECNQFGTFTSSYIKKITCYRAVYSLFDKDI